MVKSYVATQQTQAELANIRRELGSARLSAEYFNKSSRGKAISQRQLLMMERGEPVRLTPAQKRRVQRNTSTRTVSRKREQVSRTVDRKEATLRNIQNKRDDLSRERRGALRANLRSRVQELDQEIARLDAFRADIKEAEKQISTYDDYRNIADKATP